MNNAADMQIINISDLPTPALRALIWRRISSLFADDPRPDIAERVELEDLLNELTART